MRFEPITVRRPADRTDKLDPEREPNKTHSSPNANDCVSIVLTIADNRREWRTAAPTEAAASFIPGAPAREDAATDARMVAKNA
jgi:hypothetical protein